jgi:hypothetical protein
MKLCGKCKTEKRLEEFHKCKTHKDGLSSHCKLCKKAADKKYNEENRDAIAAKKREYNERNKEHLAQKKKLYSQNNKESLKEYKRQYHLANKESIDKKRKENYHLVRDSAMARSKKYYAENKELITIKKREYDKRRRNSNPVFRLVCNMRTRIYQHCRAISLNKGFKTFDALGLTQDEFKTYIESHFVEGMTWDNYGHGEGKWSIDHTKPLCTAKTEEDVFTLNHYTNLRPMWWFDNLAKGGKYEEQ